MFNTAKIALIFISWNTAVHIYDFYLFTVIYSSIHVFIWNQNNDQFSVGRALRRYRRGHGFKSSSGLNFFRLYLHYCLSSVHYCEDWQFFCSSVQWCTYDSHKLSEYFSSIIPRTCFGGCSLPFCKKWRKYAWSAPLEFKFLDVTKRFLIHNEIFFGIY